MGHPAGLVYLVVGGALCVAAVITLLVGIAWLDRDPHDRS